MSMISTDRPADLAIPDCPVVVEFLRQIRREAFRLNLTRLWEAAGTPEDLEPNFWARENNKISGTKKLKVLRKRGGPAVARGATAALFVLDLDERLEAGYYLHYIKRYKHNPIQAIITEPTSVIAVLALCDLMISAGDTEPPTSLAEAILNEVILGSIQQGIDEFTLETIAARVARALRGDPKLPHPLDPDRRWEVRP